MHDAYSVKMLHYDLKMFDKSLETCVYE
jgi:hypothetical protein